MPTAGPAQPAVAGGGSGAILVALSVSPRCLDLFMLFYVLKRLVYSIPIALGVSVICFALVHIGPGDPLSTLLPEDAPQEVV
ncbi:MAG: hypothetical protein KDC18_18270, partial [Alphaproteobacteria bacterium]|nr:hypothetical protein [Alphaproteobacteria bacterium]